MMVSLDPIFAALFNFAGPDLLIVALVFAFPIWMVIDCVTNEPSTGNEKIVWLLVIVLAPLGSLIYFFGRKLRRPTRRSA
jgi:hypothetical protein